MIVNAFRELIVSVELTQVIGLEAPMIGLGAGYCRTTQRMLLSRSLDWERQVIGLGVWAWKRKKTRFMTNMSGSWSFQTPGVGLFKLRELISETPGVVFWNSGSFTFSIRLVLRATGSCTEGAPGVALGGGVVILFMEVMKDL